MSSSIPIRCGCAESNIIPIPSLRTAISWSCNEKGNIIMTLKITWWVSYKKLLTCAYPSMGSSMCLIGFVLFIVLVFNVVCFCFACVRFCFCFCLFCLVSIVDCVHCWLSLDFLFLISSSVCSKVHLNINICLVCFYQP